MAKRRATSPRNLYGSGYRLDGSCPPCGSFDFDTIYWSGGFRNACSLCGWWECRHTVKGGSHTSDGLYHGAKTAPTGCEAIPQDPSAWRSVAQERGGDFYLPPTPRKRKRGLETTGEHRPAATEPFRTAGDEGAGGTPSGPLTSSLPAPSHPKEA